MYARTLRRCSFALAVSWALGAAPPALAKALTVVHSFKASANLGGGITADQNGVLYGVLSNGGGCGNAGCAYALAPPAKKGGAWHYSKIYQFHQKRGEYGPEGQLTLGPAGELYGVTGYGSNIIYRLTPNAAGGEWIFTKLAVLGGGFTPNASSPLIFSNGALYGISTGGSQSCPYTGCGSFFELAPDQAGHWHVTTIDAFDGGALGGSPAGIVGPDSHGGFYVANQYGSVVVYFAPAGANWQATVAATFPGSTSLGCLVMGADGDLYGAAGSFSRARLFQLRPKGGGTQWIRHTLAKIGDHQYAPCPDIAGPGGSLIGTVFGDQDFYGGDIFQLLPPADGSGEWSYKILTKIGGSGRFGPINAVFGFGGELYTPANEAYGPPSAILSTPSP